MMSMRQTAQRLMPIIIGITIIVVMFFSFRDFFFGNHSSNTKNAEVLATDRNRQHLLTMPTTRFSCLRVDRLCIYENVLFHNGTFILFSENPSNDTARWHNELNKTEEKQGHFRWRTWTGNTDTWTYSSVPHRILNKSQFASEFGETTLENATRIPFMIQHHPHIPQNLFHSINDNALMLMAILLRTMPRSSLCTTVECDLQRTRRTRTLFLAESRPSPNFPLLQDTIQELFPGAGEFLPGQISLAKLPNTTFWIDKLVWQHPVVRKMFYFEKDHVDATLYRETGAFEWLKHVIRRKYGVNTQYLPFPPSSRTELGRSDDNSSIVIHIPHRSGNRMLLNIKTLMEIVQQERNVSIQVVKFGVQSPQEEVKLLREKVHIMIGVHGAALTNAFFMEQPGVVVQICLKQQWQTDKDIYRRIALFNGLKYVQWENQDFMQEFLGTTRITTEEMSKKTFWRAVNIEIQPSEFLRIIDAALDLHFGRRNDTVVFLKSPPHPS